MLAATPGAALLATTDLVIEDVHFRRPAASPRDIGWKALAVNLSDIAAMGGTPRYALLALAVPAISRVAEVEEFMGACSAAGASPRVGSWAATRPLARGLDGERDRPGRACGAPPTAVGARAGELVAVTGALGGSAAGLCLLEGHGAPRRAPAASAARQRPR